MQVKIVDLETGAKCGVGEQGEICVKNDRMMLGYLTARIGDLVDDEGFFRMGDLGYYDAEGNLHFTDRLKDLVKFGLHHVYPAEVEVVIESHPQVSAVSQ